MLVAVLSATTNAYKPSDPDHSHLKWGMIQYEGLDNPLWSENY